MEQLNHLISATNLSFRYKNALVLDQVSVGIKAQKLTFILGPNGSGKSTFLKILAGLLPAQKGQLTMEGKDTSNHSFHERSKLIGFLNQQHTAMFPFLVEDVVLTGRAGYINFIPKERDKAASIHAMEKTGIMHLRQRKYTELSGGEQQLVMVARILAQNPKILLLDEPTTHLDIVNQSHLLNLLKQLVIEGLTIVAVMHDPNLAFIFGDDFLFLKDKKVIRPAGNLKPWDMEFLKTIYHGRLQTIPHNGRSLLVPY